jgi:Fungal specific transcription factor domain
MDKYLSSALGRPQMLRDEDIDQPLPLLVQDEHISPSSLQTTNHDAQNPMKGAIFQIR